MNTYQTSEFTEAINFQVEKAVEEVIKDSIPTLDAYLERLDEGNFDCLCIGGVKIQFHPNHRVTATLPLDVIEGYTWQFRTPNITVDCDGTFESHLS